MHWLPHESPPIDEVLLPLLPGEESVSLAEVGAFGADARPVMLSTGTVVSVTVARLASGGVKSVKKARLSSDLRAPASVSALTSA